MWIQVQRAAASALRTLAFKNDENKNQIVECGALPMLIFMVNICNSDYIIHSASFVDFYDKLLFAGAVRGSGDSL